MASKNHFEDEIAAGCKQIFHEIITERDTFGPHFFSSNQTTKKENNEKNGLNAIKVKLDNFEYKMPEEFLMDMETFINNIREHLTDEIIMFKPMIDKFEAGFKTKFNKMFKQNVQSNSIEVVKELNDSVCGRNKNSDKKVLPSTSKGLTNLIPKKGLTVGIKRRLAGKTNEGSSIVENMAQRKVYPRPMTKAEKKRLRIDCENLCKADPIKINDVLKILRRVNRKVNLGDELTIDFENLHPKTLRDIELYVRGFNN